MGIAIAGPLGGWCRGSRTLPLLPKNWWRMKYATAADEDDDRDPGVQPQAQELVRRIHAQQLLEEAAEAVLGDVEREQAGGSDSEAFCHVEQDQHADPSQSSS